MKQEKRLDHNLKARAEKKKKKKKLAEIQWAQWQAIMASNLYNKMYSAQENFVPFADQRLVVIFFFILFFFFRRIYVRLICNG